MKQQEFTPGPMIVLFSGQACALHLAESAAKASAKTRVLLMSREDKNVQFLRKLAAASQLFNALSVLADAAEARGIPVDAARAALAKVAA
jgi:hypothetical protein